MTKWSLNRGCLLIEVVAAEPRDKVLVEQWQQSLETSSRAWRLPLVLIELITTELIVSWSIHHRHLCIRTCSVASAAAEPGN